MFFLVATLAVQKSVFLAYRLFLVQLKIRYKFNPAAVLDVIKWDRRYLR